MPKICENCVLLENNFMICLKHVKNVYHRRHIIVLQGSKAKREVWIVFACQSLGLFIGICIILLVINLTGEINVS